MKKVLFGLACVVLAGCSRPAPVPDYRAGAVYRFGDRLEYCRIQTPWQTLRPGDDATSHFLGSGWQDQDKILDGVSGRWIKEREATVHFIVYEPEKRNLSIRLKPYVRTYRSQKLSIAVNGTQVAKVALKEESWENIRISLPAESLKTGMNELALKFAYSSSRHQHAAFVESFTLSDAPDTDVASPEQMADGGWRQPCRSVVRWQMVVPRSGYLRIRTVQPGTGTLCRISLVHGERVTDIWNGLPPTEEAFCSLAGFGGERVGIDFTVSGTRPLQWSVCEVGGHIDPGDVNVYLITIDTLSADHTGMLGYSTNVTPYLDQLAEKGIRFSQAWSASNESMPSFASMLTGRYPQSHGLMRNGLPMNPQQWSLSRLLGKRGFRTAVYANWGILTWQKMTGKDFEKRRPVLGTPASVDLADTRRNVFGAGLNWATVMWRERQFLWLQSQFLHMRAVPDEYVTLFLDPVKEAYGEEAVESVVQRMKAQPFKQLSLDYTAGKAELSDLELDYWRACYDGGIRFTDDHLKAFWEGLKHAGLDLFTMAIITSDHGMSLGELHRLIHTGPPYYHLLHVPLLLLLPGHPEWAGRSIDQLVETVDIAPTVMDYLGLDVPRRMQGKSLLPLIEGGRQSGKEYAFATVGRKPGQHYYAIRNKTWAYWSNFSGASCLERLPTEPCSVECVAMQYPEQAEAMQKELAKWVRRTADVSANAEDALSDEVLAILRKSGYLESRE